MLLVMLVTSGAEGGVRPVASILAVILLTVTNEAKVGNFDLTLKKHYLLKSSQVLKRTMLKFH